MLLARTVPYRTGMQVTSSCWDAAASEHHAADVHSSGMVAHRRMKDSAQELLCYSRGT